MRNRTKTSISIWVLMWLLTHISVMAQDARFFFEGSIGSAAFADISLGQTIFVNSDADAIGIQILNPNVAVIATRVDRNFNSFPPGHIFNYYVYADEDMDRVFGTNQYEDINLRVECILKARTWKELPQPTAFVPFDINDAHPNEENDHFLKDFERNTGKTILALRRAFFWENSEDVGGLHGPYADIKIGAFDPALFDNPNWLNPDVAESYALPDWHSELPGPSWSGYANIIQPDPFDEWIDGPFGTIYSNIAVWDWGLTGTVSPNDQIGILVREADGTNPVDIMGGGRVTAGEEGLILVQIGAFGWLLLENVEVEGPEPSISGKDVYWLGGWDGNVPRIDESPSFEGYLTVYNPSYDNHPDLSNPAIPTQESPGKQFRPFTDSQYWEFNSNQAFFGYSVGLMGGEYPAGTLDTPHTYYAIDEPVIFGELEGTPTPVEQYPKAGLPLDILKVYNYPNPFTSNTSIQYELPRSSHVTLNIYDITGRRMATLVEGMQEPGIQSISWDGKNNSGQLAVSGVYVYVLKTSSTVVARKLTLIR